MTDVNDMDLVRRYADGNSEPAFAELVHRHINLVYSVALRCVNNAQDAQDVTQAVFVILAQKAAGLREHTTLTGWLYETTRFTAMRFLRTKTRRQFREQEAYMQSTESDVSSAWQQLAPLLEKAMARLNAEERTVLALRFFENKSGTETAALLGIQEWAAHKRMGRALEKLRKFFSQRGMTFSAATIAGAMSAHSLQAAPAGLAKTISVVAMTKGAASAGSTLALAQETLKIMVWSKIKTAVLTGAIVIAAAGIATVSIHVAKNQQTPPLQMAFAGYASPEAAIQSTIWAAGTGDFERLSDSVTPQIMDDFKNRMKGRSAEVMKQQLVSWANAMRDYKITQKEVVADDEVRLHIQATPSPAALHDGKTVIVMKKIGDNWKQAGEVVN